MKLDLARLVGPLVALFVLVIVVQQTAQALGGSGVWARHRATLPPPSPYARLERMVDALPPAPPVAGLRDPFVTGTAAAAASRRPAARPSRVAAAPERPVVVALVSSGGGASAAIVRWNDRYFTVQEADSLPNGFVIRRITADQVTLQRGSESLVLPVPKKGE